MATPLKDIKHLKPLITFAEDAEGFVKAIESYLREDDSTELRERRIERSRHFSWDRIVGEVEERIEREMALA